MKCNEIRELLPDLAAGTSAPAAEVNDHLQGCTDCTATLNEFRQTMALLDEAAKQPQSWLSWLRRPAVAVSMAVVLVAGTTFFVERNAGKHRHDVAELTPGTAVSDLQTLDKDHDMLSDSDPDSAASLLDDLQVQQDVNSNR